MSPRSLQFTQAARDDFRAIQRYTRRVWGEQKRDEYADQLTAAMDRLTRFPLLGQSLPQLPNDMRRLVVREHVIYYRAEPETITIVRLLHKRRDPLDLGED